MVWGGTIQRRHPEYPRNQRSFTNDLNEFQYNDEDHDNKVNIEITNIIKGSFSKKVVNNPFPDRILSEDVPLVGHLTINSKLFSAEL